MLHIETGEAPGDDDTELVYPACGGMCLHHGRIHAYRGLRTSAALWLCADILPRTNPLSAAQPMQKCRWHRRNYAERARARPRQMATISLRDC